MHTPLRAFSAIAAIAIFATPDASSQIIARNSGSLGAAGNGTHTADVTLNLPGAVTAGGDLAVGYFGVSAPGPRTTVPFLTALNPVASSPFTIEFWAMPSEVTDDAIGPCPLFNRVSPGNRSGWVFFQRGPATGWNFRMYDGNGGNLGFDLTGGVAPEDIWTHVVAVWNGTSAVLYVNGALADDTSTGSGVYNPNSIANSPPLSIGAYDVGDNPFHGSIDEVAFYPTALLPAQILAHYNAAASPIAGTYSTLVLNDGAIEYLQMPEPSTFALLALGLAGCGAFKRNRRPIATT